MTALHPTDQSQTSGEHTLTLNCSELAGQRPFLSFTQSVRWHHVSASRSAPSLPVDSEFAELRRSQLLMRFLVLA